MSKYTRGKWLIETTKEGFCIYDEQDNYICKLEWDDMDNEIEKENEANARLIAHAPEMLEALKEMVGYVEGDYRGTGNKDLTGGRLDKAQTLINKIENKE